MACQVPGLYLCMYAVVSGCVRKGTRSRRHMNTGLGFVTTRPHGCDVGFEVRSFSQTRYYSNQTANKHTKSSIPKASTRCVSGKHKPFFLRYVDELGRTANYYYIRDSVAFFLLSVRSMHSFDSFVIIFMSDRGSIQSSTARSSTS